MSEDKQVLNGIKEKTPHEFLSHHLKSCIVTLDLGTHSVDFFKRNVGTMYGKTVIVGKCYVFYTAAIYLTVKIIFMSTATSRIILGNFEQIAIILTTSSACGSLIVLIHCKASLTNYITDGSHFQIFLVSGI